MSTVVVFLGCAGGTASAPVPAPASSFVTSSAYLLQGPTGLWTPEGERLSALSNERLDDLYVIDTTKEAFFLFSKGQGVHVARRTGDRFVIERVLEKGGVTRPIGDVAVVYQRDEGGGSHTQVVNLDGKVVVDPAFLSAAGDEDLPLSEPEYWHVLDFMSRPAPMCVRGEEACSWMGPSGAWVRPLSPSRVAPFYADTVRDQHLVRNVQGEVVLDLEERPEFVGPLQDGLLLAADSVNENGRWRQRTVIFGADGQSRVEVDADILWESEGCPGPGMDEACEYVFHGDRAAVWVHRSGGGYISGYIDPAGEVVIGSERCELLGAMSGPFFEDRAFHCIGAEFWLIDRDGRRIAGPWPKWTSGAKRFNYYPFGLFFADGLAAVPVAGGWGYVDREGVLKLAGPYEVARPFRLGVAMVIEGGVSRYIDKSGKTMFEAP